MDLDRWNYTNYQEQEKADLGQLVESYDLSLATKTLPEFSIRTKTRVLGAQS